MSRKKGRVKELETQIRNLKVKQGRILAASRNNHVGLLYWKNEYNYLIDGLNALGIHVSVVEDDFGELNLISLDNEHPEIKRLLITGRSNTVYVSGT